jgi:hypothetical protein
VDTVWRIASMLAAAVIVCGPPMSASAPRVTVSSLDAYKVVLLPWPHPDFARALKPGMAKEFDALLPYTAVIKNDSDREVIAYSVLWNCVGVEGRATTAARTVDTFSILQRGANFLPHSSEVVSLQLSLEAGASQVDMTTKVSVDRLVDIFSQQISIDISLDAVLFDDGSAVGSDRAGWIPRWKAWLDAEREVLTTAVQSSDTERINILRQFATGDQDPGKLAALANHSADYGECLAHAKGYFSRSLLKELEEGNGETAMKNVRNIIGSKTYPSVHRMGSSLADPGC